MLRAGVGAAGAGSPEREMGRVVAASSVAVRLTRFAVVLLTWRKVSTTWRLTVERQYIWMDTYHQQDHRATWDVRVVQVERTTESAASWSPQDQSWTVCALAAWVGFCYSVLPGPSSIVCA
jgi:hypothetical protein